MIECMQACGVSLKLWQSKSKWEWTSLMGTDKKKLLQKLPSKFIFFLREDEVEVTKKLWEVSATKLNTGDKKIISLGVVLTNF